MRNTNARRQLQHLRLWTVCSLLALVYCAPASAITLTSLTYDAAENQLVMKIAYRGTNPDHKFSVRWDACKRLDDSRAQILGQLLDSQPNDLAREEFTQEFKLDLEDFSCRPSEVTIRTSAGFFMSVNLPAAPKNTRR
jgi:hypothetical protein